MMVLGGGNSEVRNKSLELYTNTVTFSPAGPFCVGDIISYSVSGVPSTMYQIDVYSQNSPGGTAFQSVQFTTNNDGTRDLGMGLLPTTVGTGRYLRVRELPSGSPEFYSTESFDVNALPTITGLTSVCVGSTISLSGSGIPASSDPWTSDASGFATIDNSGVVTGVSSGTANITYTVITDVQ